MSADDGAVCGTCGHGSELQPLEVWRDADGEGWWIHPSCLDARRVQRDFKASREIPPWPHDT